MPRISRPNNDRELNQLFESLAEEQPPEHLRERLRGDVEQRFPPGVGRAVPLPMRLLRSRPAVASAALVAAACVVVALLLNARSTDVLADTLEAMAQVKTAHIETPSEEYWVSVDHGLRIEKEYEGRTVIVCTADGTWEYRVGADMVTISDPVPDMIESALAEISGLREIMALSDADRPHRISDAVVDGVAAKRIDVPSDDGTSGRSFWIDTRTKRIVKVEDWRLEDGRRVVGNYARIDYDAPLAAELFAFDPPRGAVVEDLRAQAETPPAASVQAPTQVTGTVVDDVGEAVAGAEVRLRSDGLRGPKYEAQTDAIGAFALRDVAPGAYSFTVNSDGHDSHYRQVTIDPEAPPALRVRLTRACWISGRITRRTGKPLADAKVTISFHRDGSRSSTSVTTGPDGSYRAACTRFGKYDMGARSPGYARAMVPGLRTASGRRLTGIDFVLDVLSGSIRGVVYDSDGETPKPGALVWAERARGSRLGHLSLEATLLIGRGGPHWVDSPFHKPPNARAALNGVFVLRDIPEGSYCVYAYAAGYGLSLADTDTVVGRSENVTGVKVVLQPAASISGTAYGKDGQPLANVSLHGGIACVWEKGGSGGSTLHTITDDAGRYAIGPLVPGRYTVELKYD
ncbi:MAG: carboxypeptidase regulatory-like domain-containing protein, partial [Armatimonadota bacterium]